jgi:hypothetical protein
VPALTLWGIRRTIVLAIIAASLVVVVVRAGHGFRRVSLLSPLSPKSLSSEEARKRRDDVRDRSGAPLTVIAETLRCFGRTV